MENLAEGGIMADYMIKLNDGHYDVIDPSDNVVDSFDTEIEALEEIRRCYAEDVVWDCAKVLVVTSIQTLAEMHNLDQDAARRIIRDATEVVE
jgi:hypothetical protein